WLEAAAAPTATPRMAAAHKLAPSGARGAFTHTLAFLSLWIRDLAAYAADAQSLILNADSRATLERLARRLPGAGHAAPEAILCVERAMRMSRTNVNPQLALAWLLTSLHGLLAGR